MRIVRIFFFLTLSLQLSIMSNQSDSTPREENMSIVLKAMQQQFERMNVVFGDIRDRRINSL